MLYVVYTFEEKLPGAANNRELGCCIWGESNLPELHAWIPRAALPIQRWVSYQRRHGFSIDDAIRELVETGFQVAVTYQDFSLVAWHCSFPIQLVSSATNNRGI